MFLNLVQLLFVFSFTTAVKKCCYWRSMDEPVPRDFDIAQFFERLLHILNDSSKEDIIRWSDDKKKIVIWNDTRMPLEICPLLFKLCTWSIFQQTLYACRFRRLRQNRLVFSHELFTQRRLQALTRAERYELFRRELGYKPSIISRRNSSQPSETWKDWLGSDICIQSITNAEGNVLVNVVTPCGESSSTASAANVPRPRGRKNSLPRRIEGEDEIIDVESEIIDVENVLSEELGEDLTRSTPTTRSPSVSSTLISEHHTPSGYQDNDELTNQESSPSDVEDQDNNRVDDPRVQDSSIHDSSGEDSANDAEEQGQSDEDQSDEETTSQESSGEEWSPNENSGGDQSEESGTGEESGEGSSSHSDEEGSSSHSDEEGSSSHSDEEGSSSHSDEEGSGAHPGEDSGGEDTNTPSGGEDTNTPSGGEVSGVPVSLVLHPPSVAGPSTSTAPFEPSSASNEDSKKTEDQSDKEIKKERIILRIKKKYLSPKYMKKQE